MTKYIELEALKNRFAKRLVWLKKDIHDEYSSGLCDGCEYDTKLIDEIPAADVVSVVRCKDCKHYKYRMCELIGNIMDGYYHGTFDVKRPDDFCSYGVKKSGGGENAAD